MKGNKSYNQQTDNNMNNKINNSVNQTSELSNNVTILIIHVVVHAGKSANWMHLDRKGLFICLIDTIISTKCVVLFNIFKCCLLLRSKNIFLGILLFNMFFVIHKLIYFFNLELKNSCMLEKILKLLFQWLLLVYDLIIVHVSDHQY